MGRRLGQHFLRSRAALTAIIEAGDLRHDDVVLEIGPGEGVLTRELVAHTRQVIAIEKDEKLYAQLRETFSQEIRDGSLTLIAADALTYEPPERYKLIANIPYYITGAIIRKFLTASSQPDRMVLLVQKEIAERIARSQKESILSISVKAYGSPRYITKVPAGSFAPPPKVDSAILLIENISRNFFTEIDEEKFFAIVHAGFASKRKMLLGNLSMFGSREKLNELFMRCDIDPKIRAEDVALQKWRELAVLLTD
ncbi:MAG TPA: 16S rRNA (adenine(1518)-N(6)/adenine(1519)-N(6))-dimethyltransferase RsmA [Candidatus Paceibacterota bacterium]|nr:16S rRNA (adenine(1518)-N(6)/adenine(1519)-N(6))-dimethyltransferase RsmA [Candidatus Paceibacterota bacterium]